MNLVQFIDFFRDRLKIVVRVCYGVLAFLVILDIFVDKSHAHTWVEQFFGFWSLFGFVACVLIIFVSKWYGHSGFMVREDYYDE